MLTRRVQALLALNGVLIALLGALSWRPLPITDVPSAVAQTTPPSAGGRPRGQYVMVAGKVQGSTSNVLYILDTANQEMIAVKYNRGIQGLDGVGYRSLIDDGKPGGGGR